MKIYVACSSDERDRARYWIEKLKAAGFEITSKWLDIIETKQAGVANPRGDDVNATRFDAATQDVQDVRAAHVLWALLPKVPDAYGSAACVPPFARGVYYEAGVADALEKPRFFSGDFQQSVFPSRGAEFKEDIDAFTAIVAYARKERM